MFGNVNALGTVLSNTVIIEFNYLLLKMRVMIDSTHAVHENMRGHTSGVTSFGTGVIDQKSSKQKINTRSSAETVPVNTCQNLFISTFSCPHKDINHILF